MCALPRLVATIQRRYLDRYAVIAGACRAAIGALTDRRDGVVVGRQVALCIGIATRRFPEHVVGEAEGPQLAASRAPQRLAHVATEHELAPQYLHRRRDQRSHQMRSPRRAA